MLTGFYKVKSPTRGQTNKTGAKRVRNPRILVLWWEYDRFSTKSGGFPAVFPTARPSPFNVSFFRPIFWGNSSIVVLLTKIRDWEYYSFKMKDFIPESKRKVLRMTR